MRKSNLYKNAIMFAMGILLLTMHPLFAWAPQVQTNLLKEAIRILPWCQYLMCRDYNDSLMEGIVEAEYQCWFIHSGNCPGLCSKINRNKFRYTNAGPTGNEFQEEHIEIAAKYLYDKLEGLKSDIRQGRRPFSAIMFDLGYHLHPVNNYLKPPFWSEDHETQEARIYHSRCTVLARNTESIDLRTENVERIENLRTWLERMLSEDLRISREWYQTALNDKSSAEEYTRLAAERNIYKLASLMNYVLDDLAPGTPEARKRIAETWHEKYQGGRKPLDE